MEPRFRFVFGATGATGAATRVVAGATTSAPLVKSVAASSSTTVFDARVVAIGADAGARASVDVAAASTDGLKLGAPTARAREIKSATSRARVATSGTSPLHSSNNARSVHGDAMAKRTMSARGKTYPKLSSASLAAASRHENNAAYTANCASFNSFKLSNFSKSS